MNFPRIKKRREKNYINSALETTQSNPREKLTIQAGLDGGRPWPCDHVMYVHDDT